MNLNHKPNDGPNSQDIEEYSSFGKLKLLLHYPGKALRSLRALFKTRTRIALVGGALALTTGCDASDPDGQNPPDAALEEVPEDQRHQAAPSSAIKIQSPTKEGEDGGDLETGVVYRYPEFLALMLGDQSENRRFFLVEPDSELSLAANALDPVKSLSSQPSAGVNLQASGLNTIGAVNISSEQTPGCPDVPPVVNKDFELGVAMPLGGATCPWGVDLSYGSITVFRPFPGFAEICANSGSVENGRAFQAMEDLGEEPQGIPRTIRDLASDPTSGTILGSGFGRASQTCLTTFPSEDGRVGLTFEIRYEGASPIRNPHDLNGVGIVSAPGSEELVMSATCPPDDLRSCQIIEYRSRRKPITLDDDWGPISYRVNLGHNDWLDIGVDPQEAFSQAVVYHYVTLEAVGFLHPRVEEFRVAASACETAVHFGEDIDGEGPCYELEDFASN